jgi:c(7)-type cytochrome triheme protein
MMRTLCLALFLLLAAVGLALAVMPTQSITFEGGGAGPVTFSGEKHRQPCTTCHNKDQFPAMKKGKTPITMEALYAGKLCGTCHNGEQAFASKSNCHRCHQGYPEK